MATYGRFGPLVGAIDEGTSSTRFLIFAANTGEVLTFHQQEILQHCPREGWAEQNAMEILAAVKECIEKAIDNLRKLDIDPADIKAIGITNQRESTVLWDPNTGIPLYNVILWLDVRTTTTVDQVLKDVKNHDQDHLKTLCGLPVSTYFSALKVRWLMDNVPQVMEAIGEKSCIFGTIDTWLIWNLTGGKDGGLHITDVTNASRTMLMNIKTLKWEPALCKFFDIPMDILPEIRSSSEIYGYCVGGSLQGIPLSGCLGDQQAALVGQMCFKQGQAKNTYGTGAFLVYNTGTAIIRSSHGLLTTVAYRFGTQPAVYALEGSVAICGAVMKWLRDNLKILENVSDSQHIAKSTPGDGKVYFVPAFAGLYAPYWRKDARSCICGITEDTTKGQIIKAAMESVCFQTRDVLEAMNLDCGIPLTKLLVDGGMTGNSYLMQLQADLCGTDVVRPLMTETTALGAAMAAGCAEGIEVWDLESLQSSPCDIFKPSITIDERDMRYSRWKTAIKKSLGWVLELDSKDKEEKADAGEAIRSSLPCTFYLISSFLILMLADKFGAMKF